jgi:hypothetical protein
MSFTSHTFTNLPLVPTPNPDFWGNVFDFASSRFASLLFIETSTHHNPRIWSSVDSGISQIPVPDLCRFVTSGLRRFEITDLHRFATPGLRRFKIPDLRKFTTSGLRRFKVPDLRRFATSGLRRFTIPDLRRFNAPEKLISWILSNQHFEGDRFFLNSPTHVWPSRAKADITRCSAILTSYCRNPWPASCTASRCHRSWHRHCLYRARWRIDRPPHRAHPRWVAKIIVSPVFDEEGFDPREEVSLRISETSQHSKECFVSGEVPHPRNLISYPLYRQTSADVAVAAHAAHGRASIA